jgi:hypothetical protein
MSDEEDFLPPPDEEHPESLRKKWEAEDLEDRQGENAMRACRHCGKMIVKKSFSCIYCGNRVFTESGLLGRLAHWLSETGWLVFIGIGLAVILALSVLGF